MMKRIICILLMVLMVTPAVADTGLSDLSDSELLALWEKVNAEILSRPESESLTNAAGGNGLFSDPELLKAFRAMVYDKYRISYSQNMIAGEESLTTGFMNRKGVVKASNKLAHTDFIPVQPGDVIRVYHEQQGGFAQRNIRMVCCFDGEKKAISKAGTNDEKETFTVPEGVSYIRCTVYQDALKTKHMLTLNYEAAEYEEYGAVYYTIIDDFLTDETKDVLGETKNLLERVRSSRYGCALPKRAPFRQTVGIPEKWFKINMATPETEKIWVTVGKEYVKAYNEYFEFLNDTAYESPVGFMWEWYDETNNLLDAEEGAHEYGRARWIVPENLKDCSVLVIGDSTVDQEVMTGAMLDHFEAQGHKLTLLGTLGSSDGKNRNEGRAGWKASDYFTDREKDEVRNPFFNPTTKTFDFAYYMKKQRYSKVDFVVIQLGINDLYHSGDEAIVPLWDHISAMIDSILAYRDSIKILVNLPTPPNTDQGEANIPLFLYRSRVIRYNEYALSRAFDYGDSRVRCSYCHLILDPNTDIRDNVHPTPGGYKKMALEICNQINCWQNGY